MRQILQTKTTEKKSVSKVLTIDKLADTQKELMKCALGQGLWNQILEGRPIPFSVINLIKGKLRHNRLLPERLWWQED